MTPTSAPGELYAGVFVACIICDRTISIKEATAGAIHADGRQAFACNMHLQDRPRWIAAWLAFYDLQQQAATTTEEAQ